MNFSILTVSFLVLFGCGLKTKPVPPKDRFQPIESQYIKKYKLQEKEQVKKKEPIKKNKK